MIILLIILSLTGTLQIAIKQNSDPQCGPGRQHTSLMRVCLASNTTTTIIIPAANLTRRGQTAPSGGSWYMLGKLDGGWEWLVADPKGYDWSSWTKQADAKYQRRIIKFTGNGPFKITVNLTNDKGLKAGSSTGGGACWQFALWKWSSGYDSCFPLQMCHNKTAQIKESEVSGPAKAAGIVIKTGDIDTDDWFKISTGISKIDNNWLLMAEQAARAVKTDCVVCMGARPVLQVVPAQWYDSQCLVEVMNSITPSTNCSFWDEVYPLTSDEKQKPMFSNMVAAGNFSCINRTGHGKPLGENNIMTCTSIATVNEKFKPQSRSDVWWWCGDDKLYDRLPYNTTGVCASVSLILPVTVTPTSVTDLLTSVNSVLPHTWKDKRKRSLGWSDNDPTYIDSIGIPRGVPDEYKLADQIAAGFESILCWWCTTNKNVDRINYIHYNVQRLGNNTEKGFSAIHEQLSATSLMAFQNRIAVDMLLAEKGGVCAIFGDQCCTFIPNNTAADGRLTKALEGLRSLNSKMKDHSGVDTSMWDGLGDMFGKYKQLVFSIIMSIAVFTAILTLCGCCCIPCIRVLCTRMITTAIQPVKTEVSEMYALLTPAGQPRGDDDSDDDKDDGDDLPHLPDLFSDLGDYHNP